MKSFVVLLLTVLIIALLRKVIHTTPVAIYTRGLSRHVSVSILATVVDGTQRAGPYITHAWIGK